MNPEIKKEEENKKEIFLEIGTNEIPVVWLGDLKTAEGQIYIGVDINFKDLRHGMVRSKRENPLAENQNFVQADAVKLPFPDESVKTILLGNLLAELSFHKSQNSGKMKKIISEAARVLKIGGH